MNDRTTVWTDGACMKNGKRFAKAGSGIYFGKKDPRNTSCTVPGLQTNQRAEVWAVMQALMLTEDKQEKLHIVTDSMYAYKGATKQWRMKANLDLFHQLWKLLEDRDVQWEFVYGHTGNEGNERADRLAKAACYCRT